MADRNAVMKQLEECLSASCRGFRTCPYDKEWDAVKAAYDLLKELPVVVKCKNCKFWLDSIRYPLYSEGVLTDGNWFCADGEKEVKSDGDH